VTEEPEQVLEQHRVAAAIGSEEGGSEIAVGKQHRDRAGKHGSASSSREHRYQDRPHE